MYSRKEASQIRQEFWTIFGQYMAPVSSADGEKINWINYKTGKKGLQFKMEADQSKASIAVEISPADAFLRKAYYQRFMLRMKDLERLLYEKWTWSEEYVQDVQIKSRIYKELPGVSVLKREDWPAIISFLKPRIIGLDRFWSCYKYEFDLG
ncbi:MAG TPA: DUF4268 domain-containing protein [Chitinophagaceae bacterium]|nr:DUF4268 domain-containing protein [Chitinophagaceae bacterium]